MKEPIHRSHLSNALLCTRCNFKGFTYILSVNLHYPKMFKILLLFSEKKMETSRGEVISLKLQNQGLQKLGFNPRKSFSKVIQVLIVGGRYRKAS